MTVRGKGEPGEASVNEAIKLGTIIKAIIPPGLAYVLIVVERLPPSSEDEPHHSSMACGVSSNIPPAISVVVLAAMVDVMKGRSS